MQDAISLKCTVIQELWSGVNKWLIELGFLEYNLTDSRKVLGDLENIDVLHNAVS